MTFDLETAIAHRQAELALEDQQKRESSPAVLNDKRKRQITEKLIEALKELGFEATIGFSGQGEPRAKFSLYGLMFMVSPMEDQRQPKTADWKCRPFSDSNGLGVSVIGKWDKVQPLIQAFLPVKFCSIDEVTQIVVDELAKQKPRYESNLMRLQESEKVKAEIEQKLLDLRKANKWEWTSGKTIRLYQWRWITGISDGNPVKDTGWALTDTLNAEEYIQFQPDNNQSQQRTIKWLSLSDYYIPPVIEQFTFSSIEELPDELKTIIFYTLPGYQWAKCHIYDDALEAWFPSECVIYAEESKFLQGKDEDAPGYAEELSDEQPLAWVQELVDSNG